jgi:hypothetical protein
VTVLAVVDPCADRLVTLVWTTRATNVTVADVPA